MSAADTSVQQRMRLALEQALAPTHLAIEDDSARHAGHPGARSGGHYKVTLVSAGFRGRSAGIWREKRKEVGVSLLYYQQVERTPIKGWVESFRSDKMDLDTAAVYANNNDRSFLGIGATIQAGVLVDVNVRPMQAADFVLGWFTIDILDDDTGTPHRNKDL